MWNKQDISQLKIIASGPLLPQANVSLGNTLSLEFRRLSLQAQHPLGLLSFFIAKDKAVENIRVLFWNLLYYHSCPMREHTFGNTFLKHGFKWKCFFSQQYAYFFYKDYSVMYLCDNFLRNWTEKKPLKSFG